MAFRFLLLFYWMAFFVTNKHGFTFPLIFGTGQRGTPASTIIVIKEQKNCALLKFH